MQGLQGVEVHRAYNVPYSYASEAVLSFLLELQGFRLDEVLALHLPSVGTSGLKWYLTRQALSPTALSLSAMISTTEAEALTAKSKPLHQLLIILFCQRAVIYAHVYV